MNSIVNILRWFLALGFCVVVIILMNVGFPVSILTVSLLDPSVAPGWASSLAQNEKGLEFFSERLLDFIGTSAMQSNTNDPGSQAVLVAMSDSATPLGKDVKIIFSPAIIGKNLTVNAQAFYSWLDKKTDVVTYTVYLGGTNDQKDSFVGHLLEVRYNALPLCTQEQVAAIKSDQNATYYTIPCRGQAVTEAAFKEYAHTSLADPAFTKYIDGGISITTTPTEEERQSFVKLRETAKRAIIVNWLLVLSCVALILFLAIPLAHAAIAAGISLLLGGLIMSALWKSAFTSIGVAQAGAPFSLQGGIAMFLGATLIGIGVYLKMKRRKAIND